ncbi:hypothetical protein [Clostridium celatum]|uniref:Uncharacterized protein n=1 Tax=Clostridium celatum DSM 1785 TaxID=545697 RepID=L1QF21_9CLOT|nr:hypothetical protein [Clostridium celatum]EKY26594.1 hypothetical protein HMPREF0216_01779 [Clostridium celatum DSM 1785]
MALNIISVTHRGLEGILINVEVDIIKGIPSFNIIGYVSKILDRLAMEQLYYRKVRIKA